MRGGLSVSGPQRISMSFVYLDSKSGVSESLHATPYKGFDPLTLTALSFVTALRRPTATRASSNTLDL